MKNLQSLGVFYKQPKVGNSSTSKRLEKQKGQTEQRGAKKAFLRLLPFLPFLFLPASPRNCYLGGETCQTLRESSCDFVDLIDQLRFIHSFKLERRLFFIHAPNLEQHSRNFGDEPR